MEVEHSPHPMGGGSLPSQLRQMPQPVDHASMVGAVHEANLSLVKHFKLSIDLRTVSDVKQVGDWWARRGAGDCHHPQSGWLDV
jgi:hypothetical protein